MRLHTPRITGSLAVSSSILTIDTLGSVSGSATSTGSFGSVYGLNLNDAGMSISSVSLVSSSIATRFDSRETDMTLATASIAALTASISRLNTEISTDDTDMTLATASIALNESNMTLATASIAAITASLGQPVNTDSDVTFNDINSTGTITAVEVHTTFVSSSIAVVSGSNIFGDDTADSHQFTGSVTVSGSSTIDGTLTADVLASPEITLATASIAAITASVSTINDNMTLATASIAAITSSIGGIVGGTALLISGSSSSTGSFGKVHTAGKVGIGTTNNTNNIAGYNPLQLVVEGTNFHGGIGVIEHQNDPSGGVISIGKSRGTVTGAVTIVQTDDVVGRILFSAADGVDFRTNAAEIRTLVGASPAANDVPGHLLLMTNDGSGNDSTERMRIDSSGTLSTTSGSAVSYFSNGQSTGSGDATHLIAQDLDEMQQDDSDNAYHRMKALKVTKSGKLRVRFTAKNQSGAYYWSWLISKNGGGTGNLADITEVSPTAMTTLTGNALGAFSDGMADGQANSVHNYRDFDVTVTNVEPGDQIELWMRLADGGGGQVTGGGQDLFAKDFKLLSQTPSIVQNPALDFSANTGVSAVVNNATSFILDRYEEGALDVTMGAGSGTITINSSADTLFYTRIGRVVHIQGRLEVASVSGNSGEFTIIGLPYAAHDPGGDAANVIAGIYFENASSSIANNIIGIIADGSTTMAIRISGSTSAGATLADKVDADTNILISGWYHTQAYES